MYNTSLLHLNQNQSSNSPEYNSKACAICKELTGKFICVTFARNGKARVCHRCLIAFQSRQDIVDWLQKNCIFSAKNNFGKIKGFKEVDWSKINRSYFLEELLQKKVDALTNSQTKPPLRTNATSGECVPACRQQDTKSKWCVNHV